MSDVGTGGLPSERTALAWHRTALSLLAAAAILTRLTFADLGYYALACLLLTVPFAVWVFAESRSRYRRAAAGAGGHGRGGVAATSVAVMVVVIGTTELVALAVR